MNERWMHSVRTANLAILAAILLFAGFVFWPTMYRYDHLTVNGSTFPVRTNRLTGHTQRLMLKGWIDQNDTPSVGASSLRELPDSELSKVTGNARLSGFGWFRGRVYNGSKYVLRELELKITAKEKTGSVRWTRTFRKSVSVNPFSTGSIDIEVVGDDNIGETEWNIVNARGTSDR